MFERLDNPANGLLLLSWPHLMRPSSVASVIPDALMEGRVKPGHDFDPAQTSLIRPTDIQDAPCFVLRHPGRAKREPGPQKGRRFNSIRSRTRLRLSGMTAAGNLLSPQRSSEWA